MSQIVFTQCKADKHRYQCVECTQGEERWVCQICNDEFIQFVDGCP